MATASALWLLVVIVVAVAAQAIAPYDPSQQSLRDSLAPPDLRHPLGCDVLGRDLLSRVMFGSRVSLAVGILSVLLSGAVGVAIGIMAGWSRGRVDDVLMRVVDVQMSLPALLFALAILYVFGAGFFKVVTAIAIARWMVFARVSRGMTLSIREAAFIDAAIAVGVGNVRILTRHVLPNLMTPLVTLATIGVSSAMLTEASLSFLGMGIQPPEVSWGLLLSQGRDYFTVAWWVAVWPGVAITLTALSINIFASWLRTETDPLLSLLTVQSGRI